MILDEHEIDAAYYCAAAVIRQRHVAGHAVPPEVRELYGRLDNAVRVSSTRRRSGFPATDQGPSGTWIGTMATADILGEGPRWVQRHADDLGGKRFGGRWWFRETDVIDYAERLAAHGTSP